MPNTLLVTAQSWQGKNVPSAFTVLVDTRPLAPTTPGKSLYDIPSNAALVEITATPGPPNAYHPYTVKLVVAASGSMSADTDSHARVQLTAVNAPNAAGNGPDSIITQASVKLSRFREKTKTTDEPFVALKTGPGASEVTGFGHQYRNAWPPTDWTLKPVPGAHYLDLAAPIKNDPTFGKILSFKTDPIPNPPDPSPLPVDVVVLELAGVDAPKLFGVTWPASMKPTTDLTETKMLLFLRQSGGQDKNNGFFQGDYPYSFDYVERCLYESMHYGTTPLTLPETDKYVTPPPPGPLIRLRPKGVPYQVAKAGVNVVTVMPVTSANDARVYGVLKDMAETGRILLELQAFMFWRAGVSDAPKQLGHVAIATFSSMHYFFPAWLKDPANLGSDFLKYTVRALYFLDPPTNTISDCLSAARTWAGSDQRYRFYTREPQIIKDSHTGQDWNSHQVILGRTPPAAPYIESSAGNLHTATAFDERVWSRTFQALFGISDPKFIWWDAHHYIVATMLVHALKQGDL